MARPSSSNSDTPAPTTLAAKVAALEPAPLDIPTILKSLPVQDKRNYPLPTMGSPKDSQVVASILKGSLKLKRSFLEEIVHPDTWNIIKGMGEIDRSLPPQVNALNSLVVFLAINYERKVYSNANPLLTKFEGWESGNFDGFIDDSGMELTG